VFNVTRRQRRENGLVNRHVDNPVNLERLAPPRAGDVTRLVRRTRSAPAAPVDLDTR